MLQTADVDVDAKLQCLDATMDVDVVLETTAVSGLFYFSSAVADVVTAEDLVVTTAVSGSSYFFSAVADSVETLLITADAIVAAAANLNY